jgi:hypothetical protein
MRWIALVLLALVVPAGPAGAGQVTTSRFAPSADVSLPFWCDWSYDWDARCYRDFSSRLSVGGDDDKVWRAALRFPLSSIPRGSAVFTATLYASVDGLCLGPRKTEHACPARSYTIDVHPVFSPDWFREREVEIGERYDYVSFWAATPRRISWDVTDLVIDWVERGVSNDGLLLKLAVDQEDFLVGGPRLPSAEFADPALRPMLEVTYLRP